MQDLIRQLRAFAQGCRGSMWQSRDETIRLMDEAAEALTTAQTEIEAQEQRIADALAWLRDHIKEVDDDNSYWGGPHKRAYLDAPAIFKELTARAALGEQQ